MVLAVIQPAGLCDLRQARLPDRRNLAMLGVPPLSTTSTSQPGAPPPCRFGRGGCAIATMAIYHVQGHIRYGRLAYVWAMGDLNWVKGLKQEVLKSIKDRSEASARKAA